MDKAKLPGTTRFISELPNAHFLQNVIDSIEECILVLDINKNVLLKNKTFKSKLKPTNKNFLGKYKCHELFEGQNFPCNSNQNICPFDEVLRTKKPTKTIHHYGDDNFKCKYIELSITPLYDQDNNIYGFVESRRDISEHIHLNEKLKEKELALYELAHKDILTNLPNRRFFMKQLEKALKNAQLKQTQLAILFIDLDNFKKINDELGHQIGDEVLSITAKRLKRIIRKNDLLARLGGDEFVILVESLKKAENAALLAQNIINNQNHTINIKHHHIKIKSSIGISIYPNHGGCIEVLLNNADRAMYQAKQFGRNTFCLYSPPQ
ncbi:MAG: diguanylate cyclase [Pseudomonadota bacterium]